VKIRTGLPDDSDSPDAALGLWAGELPLATTWQQPVRAGRAVISREGCRRWRSSRYSALPRQRSSGVWIQ
jgi:hypothetical protein